LLQVLSYGLSSLAEFGKIVGLDLDREVLILGQMQAGVCESRQLCNSKTELGASTQ
jgi:hypothetical protein